MLSKIYSYVCAQDKSYAECMLESTASDYYNPDKYQMKMFTVLNQSDNILYEIPNSYIDNPVKIYHNITAENSMLLLHGFNSDTLVSNLYIGLLINNHVYDICLNNDTSDIGVFNDTLEQTTRKVAAIKVSSSAIGCYFWNTTEDKWSGDGCEVSPNINSLVPQIFK